MLNLRIIEKQYPAITDEAQALECYAQVDTPDWPALIELYHQLKQQHAPSKVLFLLEDIAQCNYTSMHASMSDELYFDESEYIEDEDEDEDDEKEEIIIANIQPLAVQHYLQQLGKPKNQRVLTDLQHRFELGDEEQQLLQQINAQPQVILDQHIEIKLVNVATEADKFAAKLNGYFECDLKPAESYALIRHLDTQFGLEYIGLGASLLFFIKTSRFDTNKTAELLYSIAPIYQFNTDSIEFLQQHLLQQEHLILPFVESLETFEGCYDEI